MKNLFLISLLSLLVFASCKNDDWSFPDYKYQAAYFAYQSPVRTLVFGDYIYDNSQDTVGKFQIMATMSGVYENTVNRTLNVEVDPSLCNNLRFESATGDTVYALPSDYYTLLDNKIVIPSGKIYGGVTVQLNDKFFDDPRSIKNSFVVPLKITSAVNIDTILMGKSEKENPDPRVTADWTYAPKFYTLYAVKYINRWHGTYLRRGIDVADGTKLTVDTSYVYHAPYVEKDQLCKAVTVDKNTVSVSLNSKKKGNISLPFTMLLKFSDTNQYNCTIVSPTNASYTISGTGQFVKNGDMWGNEKRNVLHLKYTVNFQNTTHTLTDTLVIRDRGVAFETFNPVVVK